MLAKRKRDLTLHEEPVLPGAEDEEGLTSEDEDVTVPFPSSPSPPPELPLPEPAQKRQRTPIQDEEAEGEGEGLPHMGSAPSYHVEEFKGAGKTYGKAPTEFKRFQVAQERLGLPPWAPYHNKEEWELAQWLIKHRVAQSAIDAYLRLKIVSYMPTASGGGLNMPALGTTHEPILPEQARLLTHAGRPPAWS